MTPGDGMFTTGVVFLLLGGAALWDLHRVETGSVTIYTTPALRDFLEKGAIPAWRENGGPRIEPVYVAAGEQYNRLRMSGTKPEADLFLHASPLFIAKGFDEAYFLPLNPKLETPLEDVYHSAANTTDGWAWLSFAWSPLMEVFSPSRGAVPDLATADVRFGFAHPTLSNNGVYTVLFFEEVSPEAGARAKARTVVQPVNARTNILGVAEGSFDVTLGYEAVAKFFQVQGARIQFEAPLLGGKRVSTPVLFSVGLVDGPRTGDARRFVDFLYTNETQAMLATFHLRSVYNITAPPTPLPPDLEMVHFDWSEWRDIERVLPQYEVVSTYG